MGKTQADQNSVFQAADSLYAADQNPTIKAVRELLGYGSNTTIHKYMSLWKQTKAEELAEEEEENDLELELKAVTQQLKQQQRNNQQLGKELLNTERKLATTEQELKELTINFNNQTVAYNKLQLQLTATLTLNDEIKAERGNCLAQMLQTQEKLITQFQNDLKQINQESLNKVSEISIKNQDAWLAEKIKNKLLETTILEFKTKLATLEQALQQEKELNQPLRKRIENQEKLITSYVNAQAVGTNRERHKIGRLFYAAIPKAPRIVSCQI